MADQEVRKRQETEIPEVPMDVLEKEQGNGRGADMMVLAQKLLSGDVTPSDFRQIAAGLQSMGVSLSPAAQEALTNMGGIPQQLQEEVTSPDPALARDRASSRVKVTSHRRPKKKEKEAPQERDLVASLNDIGEDLAEALNEIIPGVDLGITITPVGIHVATMIPGDDEEGPDVLQSAEVDLDLLGEAIAAVVEATTEDLEDE